VVAEHDGRLYADRVDSPGYVVDQPGANVALDLFVLDQHLGTMLDAALGPTGITASLYAVYSQLAQGATTPGQLTELLGLRPTTLSGYLATMQRSGHITRVRNERDGRSWLVELTESGHAKVGECMPVMRRVVRAIDAALGSPDEVRRIREVLARVDRAVIAALPD
jgi:DNA-binding MarR family transcriptional regulator